MADVHDITEVVTRYLADSDKETDDSLMLHFSSDVGSGSFAVYLVLLVGLGLAGLLGTLARCASQALFLGRNFRPSKQSPDSAADDMNVHACAACHSVLAGFQLMTHNGMQSKAIDEHLICKQLNTYLMPQFGLVTAQAVVTLMAGE